MEHVLTQKSILVERKSKARPKHFSKRARNARLHQPNHTVRFEEFSFHFVNFNSISIPGKKRYQAKKLEILFVRFVVQQPKSHSMCYSYCRNGVHTVVQRPHYRPRYGNGVCRSLGALQQKCSIFSELPKTARSAQTVENSQSFINVSYTWYKSLGTAASFPAKTVNEAL